ncbi:uncharacterized protein LOC107264251 [Cephus cinctus]|uniref:Uncharacterized protein LOC107264251 n=1 Tax=Cephus cinctus TaxID=211228 RepID=A0AAJ7BJR3_CEPCN|nr:uncharacterized protein LOC107264251 [Cephus cinctus]
MDQALKNFVLLCSLLPLTLGGDVPVGGCSCAVLDVESLDPIIEQTLQYNITCDQEGAEKCQQLCMALAQGAKEKAPAMICEKLNKHVDNLKVAVYTKSCDATSWMFTGLKSPEPICCHNGKPAVCNSMLSIIEE